MINDTNYMSVLSASHVEGNTISPSLRITREYHVPTRLDHIILTLTDIIINISVVNAYIEHVDDPVRIMQLGLMPHPNCNKIIIKIVELVHEGLSWDEIAFWTELADPLEKLRSVRIWIYYTKGYALNGVALASSYLFLFAYPDELYSSKRPKTDMSIFRAPVRVDLVYRDSIPVTRYSAGMSRGLYYSINDDNTKYCGTFYYSEPESTTLLRFNTSLRSFCKLTAACELMTTLRRQYTSIEPELIFRFRPQIIKLISGMYRDDMMYTAQEYQDMFRTSNERVSGRRMYIGGYDAVDLYSAEDSLDQRLYLMGRGAGIDVIILTNMIGSHQVVTEVLDTRDRHVSFGSLHIHKK